MTIGDVCDFKTNFKNADFWLIRKGSESTVGKPVREFSSNHIGVKVVAPDVVDSKFLYYYFDYLHQKGLFARFSEGTLNLKHISVSDIRNIPLSFI